MQSLCAVKLVLFVTAMHLSVPRKLGRHACGKKQASELLTTPGLVEGVFCDRPLLFHLRALTSSSIQFFIGVKQCSARQTPSHGIVSHFGHVHEKLPPFDNSKGRASAHAASNDIK